MQVHIIQAIVYSSQPIIVNFYSVYYTSISVCHMAIKYYLLIT